MYEFECTDFGLSQKGVHLLRSGYNYSSIGFEEISSAVIKKDAEIKNVMLTLLFAVILIALSIFQTIYIALFFKKGSGSIDVKTIVAPVLPAMVATYLLYVALKKGPVLLLEANNKKYKLRLRDLAKQGNTDAVTEYLKEKLSYRLSVQSKL